MLWNTELMGNNLSGYDLGAGIYQVVVSVVIYNACISSEDRKRILEVYCFPYETKLMHFSKLLVQLKVIIWLKNMWCGIDFTFCLNFCYIMVN